MSKVEKGEFGLVSVRKEQKEAVLQLAKLGKFEQAFALAKRMDQSTLYNQSTRDRALTETAYYMAWTGSYRKVLPMVKELEGQAKLEAIDRILLVYRAIPLLKLEEDAVAVMKLISIRDKTQGAELLAETAIKQARAGQFLEAPSYVHQLKKMDEEKTVATIDKILEIASKRPLKDDRKVKDLGTTLTFLLEIKDQIQRRKNKTIPV
ncbi:hypothetical protein ACFL5U_03410 [Candidatus Margulisiibacteriota bacterium]